MTRANVSSASPVTATSAPGLSEEERDCPAQTSGPPMSTRVRGERRFTSRARCRLRSLFQR